MENKRSKGSKYEAQACDYLEQCGYKIIEKNYYTNVGEIDIIAKDAEYLVFVEVKYRKNSLYGTPFEAVNVKKQNTIRKVAQIYMYRNNISYNTPVRFDVVGILGETVSLIKNAF